MMQWNASKKLYSSGSFTWMNAIKVSDVCVWFIQFTVGFKPTASCPWGECLTAALKLQPMLVHTYIKYWLPNSLKNVTFVVFSLTQMKVPQMLNDDDSTRQAWSPGQSWQAGQAWQGWQGCCGMTEPEVVHYNDSGLIVNECRWIITAAAATADLLWTKILLRNHLILIRGLRVNDSLMSRHYFSQFRLHWDLISYPPRSML